MTTILVRPLGYSVKNQALKIISALVNPLIGGVEGCSTDLAKSLIKLDTKKEESIIKFYLANK